MMFNRAFQYQIARSGQLFRAAVLVLIVLTVLVVSGSTRAPTVNAAGLWFVSNGGDDGNDCTSYLTTCASINAVLNKPSFVDGDTIRVAVGTYTGSGTEVVLLNKSATLSGGWDATFTTQTGMSTVDGQGARKGLRVASGANVTIDRFTIQNGYDTDTILTGGGGIYITNSSSLVISNSNIINNRALLQSGAGRGGGIFNWGGTLTLISSSVVGNSSDVGGGGIENSGTAYIVDSRIFQNTANLSYLSPVYGGGIYNIGNLVITRSQVSNNTIIGYAWGAGVASNAGMLSINNSTVSANHGEGIYTNGGSVTLNSDTVTDNQSYGLYSEGANITFGNTIVANNGIATNRSDCIVINSFGSVNGHNYNLIKNNTNCSVGTTDLLNIDPNLGPLSDNGGPTYTQALLQGSPAINAGNPAGCADNLGNPLTTDQRGFLRPDRCDIGAFEFLPLDSSTKSASKSTVASGESVTFDIVLPNGSTSTITNAQVSDTLPASLIYNSNSLTATSGSYNFDNGVVTWNGSVPAGGDVEIGFSATPSSTFGIITNSAIISGGGETITRSASIDIDTKLCLTKDPNNPVLVPGSSGAWDAARVFDPSILKEGATFKMWYTGDDNNGNRGIGYATSPDGVTWSKFGGNPVLAPSETWEGARVGSPTVINDSGTYKMWYVGRDTSGVSRIGYATSPDGISWTKYSSNPVLGPGTTWDSSYVFSPSVVKVNGTYHMWYAGWDGVTSRIGHATSVDGINWTKDLSSPVLDIGAPGEWDWIDTYAPSVVYFNGNFVMWYSGDALPAASQTGYAISTDGIHWTRKGKVIPEGDAGAFDAASADYAAVLADGNNFDIWYSGLNAAAVYSVGYAATQICGASQSTPPNNAVFLPLVGQGIGGGSTVLACPAYYTDDFSDATSGWPIIDDSNHTEAYVNGEYQIRVKVPYQGWLVTPGGLVSDFIASVTARNTSANDGLYGIDFGINNDWSQYYEFDLSSNYYSIWKWNGAWTALKNWTTSSYVAGGANANRLKVIRDGATISVYANDHFLTSVSDNSFTGLRRFGLEATAPSTGPIDVRFDDFALYPVSCGSSAHAPQGGTSFQVGVPDSMRRSGPPVPK